MSRWKAGGIVALLAVGGWWVWGAGDEAPAGAASGPVVVQQTEGTTPARPAAAEAGRRSPEAAVPLRRESPAPAAGVAAAAETAAAKVRGILDRATALVDSGKGPAAEALLRKEMGATASAEAQARLGLYLAPLTADLLERRRLLSMALRLDVVVGAEWEDVGEHLRVLNRDPRSSLHPLVPWESYVVQPGDSLWKLCNRTFPERFGARIETGMVRLFNGLASDTLQVGQTLLVPKGTMLITVDREDHGLALYAGDVAVVAYRVGLGKEGRTPRGEFVVEVKQTEPTWYRNGRAIPYGDPENILGTRWMGFENTPGAMGYGIHGTDKPASVGFDESMGCVRMRNGEVEELFELVPRGTRVIIP